MAVKTEQTMSERKKKHPLPAGKGCFSQNTIFVMLSSAQISFHGYVQYDADRNEID